MNNPCKIQLGQPREFLIIERPQKREKTTLEKKKKIRAKKTCKNQKKLAQIFFAGVENKNRFQKGEKLDSKTEEKTTRCKLEKNQWAFCKEFGHQKDKCPKKNLKEGPKNPKNETPSPDSHILYAGEDSDQGGQGSKPLPKSWVTINVEGKPVGFMVDTGAQYSVLNQKDGPMSKKVAGCREQPGLNDMDGLQNGM